MLKTLADEDEAEQGTWLAAFWKGNASGVERGKWGDRLGHLQTANCLAVPYRFPKTVLGLAVLPVQRLLSCPVSEHHPEQEHCESSPAR